MKFRDFHPNIKLRIIFGFFSEIIGSMIFPFMAIYFTIHFGAKLTGLLLIFNVIIGAIVGFYGGYLSDKVGRKKLMVTAEGIRFVSMIVMTIANSPWFESPLITFFMFLVGSICWGIEGPATDAMLIDVSKPPERKLMYAIMYWSSNLSIAIGGSIGAFLFEDYLFELFIGMTVMTAILFVVITFFIQESYTPQKVEKPVEKTNALREIGHMFRSYKVVALDKIFLLFVLAGMFIQSLEMQLTNYIAVRLHQDMTDQSFFLWSIDGLKMTGLLRTENTVLVVILAAFVMKWIQSYKDKNVFLWSIVLFTLGYTTISYFNNVWVLFIAMFIATMGELMRVPVQQSYMSALPPDDKRSSYMAVMAFSFQGSMILASISITLSAYFSREVMSLILLATGIAGYVLIDRIIPALEHRSKEHEKKHEQEMKEENNDTVVQPV